MLLPILVHREALERQHPSWAELWLYGTGDEDRALHFQILDPAFHQRELECDDTCHLDCTAERDLSVTLAEMQISYRELGTWDVHGEVSLASARQVLDVAVAAVLGSAGNCAGAFGTDLGFEIPRGSAGVDVFGLGEVGNDAVEGVEFDKLRLAAGPLSKDLR